MLHRQPADNIHLIPGGIKLRVINDAGRVVRRVALSVVRTGQPHIGRRQSVPAGGVGMGAYHIIHQAVGLGQHAALGPAGGFHGHAQLCLRNEITQVFGIGGGEGLIDGLVRIAHPHPVAGPGRQQAQHLFLDQGAVLGLILQDIGPAVLQVRQVAGVRSQQPVGVEHQVRKIHGGIVPQLGLIKAVDVADHLQQRTGKAVIRQRQVIPQLFGRDVVILRLRDHVADDVRHVLTPFLPVFFILSLRTQVRVDHKVKGVPHVRVQPQVYRPLQQRVRPDFIQYREVLCNAQLLRMAPDDIQRHAVKGADLIADAGQQPPLRQKGCDAGGEVQGGGIGKCDDQDLLVRLLISAGLHQFFDEVRGQGRERESLPAARDS